jgi:hypothetical protein
VGDFIGVFEDFSWAGAQRNALDPSAQKLRMKDRMAEWIEFLIGRNSRNVKKSSAEWPGQLRVARWFNAERV